MAGPGGAGCAGTGSSPQPPLARVGLLLPPPPPGFVLLAVPSRKLGELKGPVFLVAATATAAGVACLSFTLLGAGVRLHPGGAAGLADAAAATAAAAAAALRRRPRN